MTNIASTSGNAARWASAALPEADAEHLAAEAGPATSHADDAHSATTQQSETQPHAHTDAGPTFLQSIEQRFGMPQHSLRYETMQDFQGAKMVPVFKIEGGGAIHEQITQQAAKNAGIKFSDGMDKGVAWPDVPCENPKKVDTCYYGTWRKEHDEGTLANRSHHGDLQFWHSMAPKSDKPLKNKEVVEKIIGQAKEWYTEGVTQRSDFAIGKLLHMVQDSFSASHVVRDDKGRVVQFQGYDAQNPKAHGHADEKGAHMDSFLDIPGANNALKASTKILQLYAKGAPFSEVEKYLRTEVYPMAPSRSSKPAGGSAPPYAKKTLEA